MSSTRILIVATSAGRFERVGFRTGLWLGELVEFWDVLEAAGHAMDIATPAGGRVPLDPESLMLSQMGHAVGLKGAVAKRYEDAAFMSRLDESLPLADVDATSYDAIYLTGGHGVMFDFPASTPLGTIVGDVHDAGKIVSAVCHGPSGLLEAKLASGAHLVEGKAVTGFSWPEELAVKRQKAVPFRLDEELQKRGARYEKAKIPFAPHVVTDGQLVTGQNPASASGVAKRVAAELDARGGGGGAPA